MHQSSWSRATFAASRYRSISRSKSRSSVLLSGEPTASPFTSDCRSSLKFPGAFAAHPSGRIRLRMVDPGSPRRFARSSARGYLRPGETAPGPRTVGSQRSPVRMRAGGAPGRVSAAAHQTPDRGHQLVGELFQRALRVPVDDAVAGVAVEEPECHLVQRGLDRGDLGDDIDAVAVVLDHSLDAAHLAFDALEARE